MFPRIPLRTKDMVINNFPIKFSVRPELVEGWTENSRLMLSPVRAEFVEA